MTFEPTRSAEEELQRLRRRVAELEASAAAGPGGVTDDMRKQLAWAVAHAPIIIWAIDSTGQITLSQGRGLEGLGRRQGELVGQNVFELYADRPRLLASIRQALAGEEYRGSEDIAGRVLEGYLAPLRDAEGRIIGASGVASDITEHVEAERGLRQARDELEQRVAERTAAMIAANETMTREVEQRMRAERHSQEQAAILQSILDNMPDGVVVADREGKLLLINPAGAQIVGLNAASSVDSGANWFSAAYLPDMLTPYPPDAGPVPRAISGESVDAEEVFLRHPARPHGVWIQVNARPLRDGEGERRGGVVVFRDITQQKRALAALGETEARLQSVLDNTPAIVSLKDTRGRYLLANRAFETSFGLTQDQIIGLTDDALFIGETAEQFRRHDAQVLSERAAFQFEETVPRNGSIETYLSVKFPICNSQGVPHAVCGISTDITQRKEAEERLRCEQAFLKQLLRAHERDRQLMAYEIHDGLVQYISGALMHLESFGPEQPKLSDKARGALELASHLLRRSIAEGRRVMSGLRPPILDEEGIVLAISYLVAEQTVPGELVIGFSHQVQFDRLEPLLEGTIFRIVQEALTNVRRHSKALRAEVKLVETDGRLRLEVRDWGVGFDPGSVPDDRFGLEGIRKRADLVGGQAHITSACGEGTRVVVDLPVTLRREEGNGQ
jgi:PAS domain S-box-containing protein